MSGPSPNADAPRNVTKYLGNNYQFVPGYTRTRAPTTGDLRDPKNQGYYPKPALWINSTNQDLYALVRIANNLATWVLLGTGGLGPVLQFPVPLGTTPVVASGGGNISLTSTGGTLAITGSLNAINFDLTGGGLAVDQIVIDAATGPGTNPTLPTALGQVSILGVQVAAGAVAVRTNAVAANAFRVEVQRSSAVAATDITKNGLSHFSSAQFAVDANGFVSLSGGTAPATQKFDVQANTGPGTDPVVPDGSGVVIVNGSIVAAHSIPLQTNSLAANAFNVEAQYASAAATSVATNAGMASFSSDDFAVDSNGYVALANPSIPTSGVSNIGFTYASPTFTVHGFDGTALSATNPGYVWVQNKANPGRLTRLTITENYTFTDSAAGTTDNQRFGLVTGVNWSDVLPFFLHCVQHDTPASAPAFGISRNPAATSSPAAASIGVSGAVVNVDQADWFLLTGATTGIPAVASYDANPSLCIGSFRATFVGATDSWTVAAIAANDGINEFNSNTKFTLPAGVNGSAAGTYFQSNAGTEPQFVGSTVRYCIQKDAYVDYAAELNGCNVAGVGANELQLTLPYLWTNDTGSDGIFAVFIDNSTSIANLMKATSNGTVYLEDFVIHGTVTTAFLTNASIQASDEFSVRTRYKAY